jgi:hypothetical protein
MKETVKNLLLASLLASALTCIPRPAHAALMAQFKLDEGAIDTATNLTYSADGLYTGTFTGAAFPLWITNNSELAPLLLAQSSTVGAITNAASGGYAATDFWGTNAAGTSSVLGTNARTVTAWVRTAVTPTAANAAYIVSYGSGSTIVGGRFSLRLDTTAGITLGKVRLEVSSGSIVGTNSVITDNNWHHLAVVCQANCRMSNVLIYVDGNLQQTTTTTPTVLINTATNFNPVQIGNSALGLANSTFLGSIDDVRIYDEVLSGAQIAQLVYGPGNPPGISQQPVSQSAYLGATNASATFTVGVSGSPTLLYTWKKSGVAISGATNQSYTISPVTAAKLGSYTVSVTNAYGGTSSGSATLSWSTPPVDPSEMTLLVGGSGTFSVTMPSDSTGYTYQWLKGGVPIVSATSASYSVASAALSDAANYAVAVTLSGQSATSAPVALHVFTPPASSYAALVLGDRPSAYWRLGETNGAPVMVDMTGFHPGSYSNYSGSELQQAGALTNDTDTASGFYSANYVEVPVSAALQHNTAFSLEAWVNLSSVSGYQSIICSRNQQFSSGYDLAVNGASWLFRTGNSTSPAAEIWNNLTAPGAEVGVWHHIVGTYDGATKQLYVDGVLVNTQATNVLATPVPLRVGAGLTYLPTPGNYLNGTIDEPAVYPYALSDIQVYNHYSKGALGALLTPVLLSVAHQGNNVVLTWPGTGQLQQKLVLDNDPNSWTDVPGAVSPYTVPGPQAPMQFFRLRRP